MFSEPAPFQKPLQWGLLDRGKTPAHMVEARSVIETAILELAVQRVTEQQLEELDALVTRMERCTLADRGAFIDADREFHRKLAEATGNAVLVETINFTLGILSKRQIRGLRTRAQLGKSIAVHRDLFAAIRARDLDAARISMQAHDV